MNLRKEFQKVLDNTAIEEMFEPTADFALASSCAKILNADVYIWAESELHIFARLFKTLGLRVSKIVSAAPKTFDAVDDIPIVTPTDIKNDRALNKFFFVNSTDYDEKNVDKICGFLQNEGVLGSYVLTKYDWIKIVGHHKTPFDLNRIEYYQSHKKELLQCFDMLADDASKRTLTEYLRSYISNQPYRGEQTSTRYKYFFGAKGELLYKRLPDECWVNCGASIGDTIFLFLSFGLRAKKIYAFEGDPNSFQRLKKNLELLTPELRSPIEPINQLIDASTDFNSILKGNRCTLLNADIEGSELQLLQSMSEIIKRDRPVIALCMYHRREDLVEIPAYLKSICSNYVWYLRKYNTGWLQNYKRNHELAMYAVPRERSL